MCRVTQSTRDYWLHNFWDPVQNENASPLVKKKKEKPKNFKLATAEH